MTICRNCQRELVFAQHAFYDEESGYFYPGWVDTKEFYVMCLSGLSHNPIEDAEEFEDAHLVSAADLPEIDLEPVDWEEDDEWDNAAETADDARRGK